MLRVEITFDTDNEESAFEVFERISARTGEFIRDEFGGAVIDAAPEVGS